MHVYYKTSATGAWTEVASYTSPITDWTEENVTIPYESTTELYIAFEGVSGWGYGVGVDDVVISGAAADLLLRLEQVLLLQIETLFVILIMTIHGLQLCIYNLKSDNLYILINCHGISTMVQLFLIPLIIRRSI